MCFFLCTYSSSSSSSSSSVRTYFESLPGAKWPKVGVPRERLFSNLAFNLPFLLSSFVVVTNKKKKENGCLQKKGQIHQYKKYPYKSGFLLKILWCSQSGYHPGNNLAKFGYKIDMKGGGGGAKEEKQNPFIFLATFWKLLKDFVISNFFKFEIWQMWAIFFPMKNPLYRLKSYFSSWNLAKILQHKKHWDKHINTRSIPTNTNVDQSLLQHLWSYALINAQLQSHILQQAIKYIILNTNYSLLQHHENVCGISLSWCPHSFFCLNPSVILFFLPFNSFLILFGLIISLSFFTQNIWNSPHKKPYTIPLMHLFLNQTSQGKITNMILQNPTMLSPNSNF